MEWCAAGLDPEAFWKQTPRTYRTIMEGRRHAVQRRLEDLTFIAFQGERMARDKRPKLKTFMNDLKPKSGFDGRDLLAHLRSIRRQGAPVKITRLKKGD